MVAGDGDAKASNLNTRSNLDQYKSHAGQAKNTISAKREHNINTMELLSDPDLKNVIDTWKNLPKAVKQGIIAMVEHFYK